MNTKIYTFVRDPRTNQLRGCVMAKKLEDGTVGLGWSYTNLKAGDRFNKERAVLIAEARCNQHGTKAQTPYDVKPVLEKITHRAVKYFLK